MIQRRRKTMRRQISCSFFRSRFLSQKDERRNDGNHKKRHNRSDKRERPVFPVFFCDILCQKLSEGIFFRIDFPVFVYIKHSPTITESRNFLNSRHEVCLPLKGQMQYNGFMAVQTQQQPVQNRLEEEEETVTETKSGKPSGFLSRFRRKEKKPVRMTAGKALIITLVCIGFLAAGRCLRSTTLFLEDRSLDHYLSAQDYLLVDEETGKPTQNLRSFSIRDQYAYDSRSNYLMTSRGLKIGDDWDRFVELYGDVYADNIYCYQVDENGYTVYDTDSVSVYEPILVRDFDEQYVKTGKVSPERDVISVNFRASTDGIRMYYSEKEMDRVYDEYYDNPLAHPFSSYPHLQRFNLSLDFEPASSNRDITGLSYISSYYYR